VTLLLRHTWVAATTLLYKMCCLGLQLQSDILRIICFVCFAIQTVLSIVQLVPEIQENLSPFEDLYPLWEINTMGGGEGYRNVAYFVNWVSIILSIVQLNDIYKHVCCFTSVHRN
jgi:hypothetical protein